MSWFLSLMLVGAVLTSGNNLPTYEYQNATAKSPKIIKKLTQDETETFEKTYPFNPNGKIEVSNINGSIYIEAWDRPEIYLSATKTSDSKERLQDVQIEIQESQSNFRVETDFKRTNQQHGKKYKHSKLYVTFRLKVPRTAFLDEIETVNGSVEVSNMTNYTRISAVNGAVKASNLRGTAKLDTVNGTVYADFDDLNDSSSISLGTVNGSVKLNIPSNANATVKASTVNGSISNGFSLPVRKGKYVGRDLYGRIGNGNVKIKLSSVNGGLSINNKDGGTTNPAVNLLQQKTSDDFDDSFEVSVNIDTEKLSKEIDKALNESRKSLDMTRNELTKQREIEREKRKIERTKERELRRIERAKERQIENSVKHKLNKEKFKEIEDSMERVEESMVRASEALYLTRRSPFIQEKTGTIEVVGIPTLSIDAEDCNVSIKGWDKQEVKYVISRMTQTGNRTEDLKTRVSRNKSDVEIEVTNDSPATRSANKMINQVRVEVYVPKKSNLKVTSNLEIRLEGISGELELNGNDGSINVRDSYGRLRAETTDGTIRVIGFKGEVETTAVDGDIYLEGYFKKIRSESNDGDVYLTLPEDSNAKIWTKNIAIKGQYKLGSQVSIGGLSLVKESENTWIIGKGLSNYNFGFAEGKLIVRSKSSLSSN